VNVLVSFLSGAVAGLALAAPLGAIGVLLVQEGITRGLRRGLPSAAAVATVDILYCTAAVTAGALAGPIVSGWSPWPQIMGGLALIAIGVHGLLRIRRSQIRVIDPRVLVPGTSRRRFVLFLGLTALNPATLVYFTAILTGLDQVAESPLRAIAFIAGVGIASLGWQALLVTLGAGLGQKTGPSFQRWTAAIGNGLVVLIGAALLAHVV
jgi:arginine exporter protein ArgO